MVTLDALAHSTDPQHKQKHSALFHHCLNAILWFLFMAMVKTRLTVHLYFSSAISCDDEGGREEDREKVCGGGVLKLASSGDGCHHHCNQFRLVKLHPRLLRLHIQTETVKVKQGFIGKEISKCNCFV